VNLKPEYKKLFEPIQIGNIKLRNRIVMLPMETSYASQDGFVTDRMRNYYQKRATDVGLVLIQITCVESRRGKGYAYQLCIDDDKFIPGLTELVQSIHDQGAKFIIQLHHAGANARGEEIVAASPIRLMPGRVIPKELSVSEIEKMLCSYALAAERAKTAGFDGVEVVASGNYLVWNFLSPTWNKRNDAYGGDLQGRAKLFVDIIKAIKSKNRNRFSGNLSPGIKGI